MLLRKSSFKLSLAVATALASVQALAAEENRAWNCLQDATGNWQCAGADTDASPNAAAAQQRPTAASDTALMGTSTAPGSLSAPAVAPRTQPTVSLQPPTATAAKTTVTAKTAANSDAQPYAALDWYYYAPGEATSGSCPGRYVEPELNLTTADTPFQEQSIILEALRSTTELGGTTQLEGGISILQDGRSLTSESAQFDQNTRIATLRQDVRYRERGLLFTANSAVADLNSGDTRFDDARYVLHAAHMRGSANQITRYGDERIVLEDGAVTFCDPSDSSWSIGARKLNIYTAEGYGDARHAWFEVADVPILYLPYIYFPIDDSRRTGFLYPSISNSSSDGLDLSVPYYINLAPNYDDTLTPRLITKRGLMLENEFRYLNDWSMNTLSAGYLADDDKYGDTRWLLGVDHLGNPKERWFTKIDYTRTSDKDYLDDLDSGNLEIANQDDLNQLGEVRYQADTWQFITRVHKYQTTDDGDEPYEKVPQILFSGREVGLQDRLDLSYLADYTYFDSQDQDTVGGRLHLRPALGSRWEKPWGYIHPRLTYWLTRYDLKGQPDGESANPSLAVPIISVDSGLRFERTLLDGMTQTLEPRAKYIHAENDDRDWIPAFDSSRLQLSYYNLFDETGYSGNDNVAGTDQVTLGLESNVTNAQGIEKLRIGIAQAYYFEDRDTSPGLRPGDITGHEQESNLGALVSWSITPTLKFTHDSEIDNRNGELLQQSYRLSYQPDSNRLVYFSFRDNTGLEYYEEPEDEVRQTDLAFRWPLSPTWNVIGRWQQDLLHEENLETLLGVEYGGCCWKVRLTGRQWVTDANGTTDIDRDSGVFLQFVLRGLGSFGQGGGREFLTDITGNNEEEYDKF